MDAETSFYKIVAYLDFYRCIVAKSDDKGNRIRHDQRKNRVFIVLNDTLRKFRESKAPDRSNYIKLTEDTTLSLFAKPDGTFQIAAGLTDSFFFESFRHKPQAYRVADLLKTKSINIRLEPEVCSPYVPCNDTAPARVYIFVEQKVSLTYEPEPCYCNVMPLDARFKAVYKILEQEAGNFPNDTITFSGYAHNARFAFSNYQNVLLFVGEYCGELYHEKYQFFDLYKTADGRWASPGDPYKYDERYRKNITAQRIQFADTVWFDISKLSEAAKKQQFPAPFFKIEKQRAIPVMGSYVEELIAVKKEGVLKERKVTFAYTGSHK